MIPAMARPEPEREEPAPEELEIAQAVALPRGLEDNPGALQAEFARQPGDAARWRWRRGKAHGLVEAQKTVVKVMENRLDRAQARARLRIKGDLKQVGNYREDKQGRRVNDEDLEALVCIDEQVVIAADALTAALGQRAVLEERLEVMKGAVAGFEDKRDMLIQMGAQARAEMVPDPSIRRRS